MAVGDIFTAALQSVGELESLGINSGVSVIIHSGHMGYSGYSDIRCCNIIISLGLGDNNIVVGV